MKRYLVAIPILIIGFFLSSDQVRTLNIVRTPTPQVISTQETSSTNQIAEATPVPISDSALTNEDKELPPTPEPFPDLYECNLEIVFTTGPLAGSETDFFVLGKSYFENKGDSFFPGKNTAVYYDPPRYLILHSAFENGNMLKPLEAEFIRYYLEYWGESGNAYVQGNIDSLIGSTVIWKCNDKELFSSTVREIVRLSQIASDQLWLEPRNLEAILVEQEGLVSEWIGAMEVTYEPTIYLGFCGWGPESSGDLRFAYYRYLMNFDLELSP